jgi:hypothetical protein
MNVVGVIECRLPPRGQAPWHPPRFFCELIEEKLDSGGELADVTGQRVLDRETYEEVSEEIERLGNGTLDRISDETS